MRISSCSLLLNLLCASGMAIIAAPAPAFAAESIDIGSLAAVDEPPAFDTPEAAVDAFKAALAAADGGDLAKLLGLDFARVLADESTQATFEAIREGAAKHLAVKDLGPDRKGLELGERLWLLPFPLVKGDDGKWAFDTYAGLEEIVNRRVGENELQAIETMRAYVEAQKDYAADDHDEDGVLEYAQKLVSSEGLTDGLYWPADAERGESPAGNLDEQELDDASRGEGYFGYKFRILTGQGDNIAGGAYDYVINGNMIAGFALLAWPAKYEQTGVQSFLVNQHGTVYEADLGPGTDKIVKFIERFNPDNSWAVVAD